MRIAAGIVVGEAGFQVLGETGIEMGGFDSDWRI